MTSTSGLTWLKSSISVIAILLLVARMIWPNLKVDTITLGLMVVAVLPWLSALISSAKFPGGWEVTFKDLEAAGNEITQTAPPPTTAPPEEPKPDYVRFANGDSNLILVGFRIEIETRLRKLADAYNIKNNLPLIHILKKLASQNVFMREIENALLELITSGNSAAHGALVNKNVALWAINSGPKILDALDRIIEEHRTSG